MVAVVRRRLYGYCTGVGVGVGEGEEREGEDGTG